MTMKETVAQCHLLASVLVADGIMTDAERDFLAHAMNGLGLSEEEREQVVTFSAGDTAHETLAKLPLAERRAILDELVAAALVDGKLSPYETKVVEQLTAKLGFGDA
jgi:tellurite resistance protein